MKYLFAMLSAFLATTAASACPVGAFYYSQSYVTPQVCQPAPATFVAPTVAQVTVAPTYGYNSLGYSSGYGGGYSGYNSLGFSGGYSSLGLSGGYGHFSSAVVRHRASVVVLPPTIFVRARPTVVARGRQTSIVGGRRALGNRQRIPIRRR